MSLQKIELVRFPETDSEELREYKKKVYEVARQVQDEETWCQDGFNAAMNDLGIPMAVNDDGWVGVKLVAGPLTVTMRVDPENLDGSLEEQVRFLVAAANTVFYSTDGDYESEVDVEIHPDDVTYIGLADDEKPSHRDNVWGVHPYSAAGAKSHLFVGFGSSQFAVTSACGSVMAQTSWTLKPDSPSNRCMNCSKFRAISI